MTLLSNRSYTHSSQEDDYKFPFGFCFIGIASTYVQLKSIVFITILTINRMLIFILNKENY